jgi:hypothetical protein
MPMNNRHPDVGWKTRMELVAALVAAHVGRLDATVAALKDLK